MAHKSLESRVALSDKAQKITQVPIMQSNYDDITYTKIANHHGYNEVFRVLSQSTKELNIPGLHSFIDHTGDSTYTIIDVSHGFGNIYRQLVVNILRSNGSIVRSIHHTFKYSIETIGPVRSQNHTVGTYDHEL